MPLGPFYECVCCGTLFGNSGGASACEQRDATRPMVETVAAAAENGTASETQYGGKTMRLTAKINFINQAHANITIWQDGGNTGTNTVSACCAQQFVDYINDYDESVLVNQAKVEGTIADAERTADHAEAVAEHGLTGDCNVETYPAPEPLVDPFTCLADCITVMGRAIMAINPPHTLAQIAVQTATRLLPEMRDLDDQKNRDNAEFRRETAEKYTGMDTTPYDAVERAMEPEKGPA